MAYEKEDLQQAAGYVARDPETKPGRDGEDFVSFSIGVNTGYGDDSETKWLGVAVNRPDLQDWVMANVRKGNAVVVEGFGRTVTRGDNTYNNFSAFRVGKVDWYVRGSSAPAPRDDDDF
jgi:single-stranded DNA-binding protein